MSELENWLGKIQHLHPTAMDLSLSRVAEVAAKMALNPLSCPVITVAGTNGKGTSVALLEAIFLQAGYRTGVTISPHLLCFNERIRINGDMATDAEICQAFAAIEAARGHISLTYFEFGLLAALWCFAQNTLDVVILEVGLGGRLDATNIVDADYALITTIDIDHTEYLGPDRESIGREKAGIFRSGQLAVCGDQDPPQSILQTAHMVGAQLSLYGRDYQYQHQGVDWCYHSDSCIYDNLPIPNIPLANAAAVLCLCDKLRASYQLSDASVRQALASVAVLGRWQQQLVDDVVVIFDIAHNPQATRYLAQKLEATPCAGRTFAVFCMMKDKDISQSILPMMQQIDQWYLMQPNCDRAATPQQLAQCLTKLGGKQWKAFTSPIIAYTEALADAQTNDRVVVFGSCYGVASILSESHCQVSTTL